MKNVLGGEKKLRLVLIGLILLTATWLRFYQLDFGRPYLYHPDEIKLVAQAGRLLETRFADKEAYFGIRVYPPFYTYLLAIAIAGYVAGAIITGHFPELSAVKAAYFASPFQFFLVGRVLVAFMGIATCWLLYLLGKKIYSEKTGLLAALFLAVNFLHVRNSHFSTVDVPVTFFTLLSLLFIVELWQRGWWQDYCKAAAVSAVAVATKFNMIFLLVPFFLAHLIRHPIMAWPKALFSRKFILSLIVGILVFVIVCPLIWLDFKETWGGILGTHRFEKAGKIGSGGAFLSYWTGHQAEGVGVFYPNSIPATCGRLCTICILGGMIAMMIRHTRIDLVLLLFIFSYYGLLEAMSIKAMRHLLPLFPLFMLAAAQMLVGLQEAFKTHRAVWWALLALAIYIVGENIYLAVDYLHQLSRPDPRSAAAEWVLDNLPVNTPIVVEDFPPPIGLAQMLRSGNGEPYLVFPAEILNHKLANNRVRSFCESTKVCYYIADSFTERILNWPYTKQKYPAIYQDRLNFYHWLTKSSAVVQVFKSKNESIQPSITIRKMHEIERLDCD